MPRDKALVAAAGVYYAAFKLSSLGYAVSLTLGGTEGVDLLAAIPPTREPLAIQVKTMSNALGRKRDPYWKWHLDRKLKEKIETEQLSDSFFVTFVDLHDGEEGEPDVYVVPSADLDEVLKTEKPDEGWFTLSGELASEHKNNWGLIKDYLGRAQQ